MYSALITGNIWQNKFLCKLKLPLKINFFLWYLNKGVTLTKNNLARRNWTGCKSWNFWAHDENIQHLFSYYHYARFLWLVIFFTFGIQCPISINDMFSNWLLTLGLKQWKQLLVGTLILCWAVWTDEEKWSHFLKINIYADTTEVGENEKSKPAGIIQAAFIYHQFPNTPFLSF
jgi:hypothetical protein